MKAKLGDRDLEIINRRKNRAKYFCHFTGFLEGIAASGYLEKGEAKPLIAESIEFVRLMDDLDANDVIEDFEADLLDFATIEQLAFTRLSEIDFSDKSNRINRFLGYCRGISCDGVITVEEAIKLVEIAKNDISISSDVGIREIVNICYDAIDDGIVSIEESNMICDDISKVAGDSYAETGLSALIGVANFDQGELKNGIADLFGASAVLTGSFKISPRTLLEKNLQEYGVSISKTVSKKVQYLIIGGEPSRDWLEMNRGTKIKKAIELRASGEHPIFLSEYLLMQLMANSNTNS